MLDKEKQTEVIVKGLDYWLTVGLESQVYAGNHIVKKYKS